jgi:hypothetical protein
MCKHKHEYKDTGKTLRNNTGSSLCIECSKYVNKPKKKLNDGTIFFDKFYMGPLCARKGIEHDFEGIGKSLRYISNSKCKKCQTEQVHEWTRKQSRELTDYYIAGLLVHAKLANSRKEARQNPQLMKEHREYIKRKRDEQISQIICEELSKVKLD